MSTNNFFAKKKDWSKTKDSILGSYLTPYFYKLLAYHRPICYIDCFAGKGKFDDGENGSPLIALECIKKDLTVSKYVKKQIKAYFIELNHFKDLENNLIVDNIDDLSIEVVGGRFEDNIDLILNNHPFDTVFLYVDPYGIKALDVKKFCSFKTNETKSVEMLINFNTWGFFREACRVLKVDFKLDDAINEYLVEYEPANDINRDELTRIAGGDFWIKIVQDFKNQLISSKEAEKLLADGISDAFKSKYKYVLNVPVRSNQDNIIPKYRLFHLTNHDEGCLIMADIMYKRINESIERQQGGQMSIFEFNTEGNLESQENTKQMIKDIFPSSSICLTPFLCEFFTKFGIETGSSKLIEYIKELEYEGFLKISRFPDKTTKGQESTFMREDKKHKVILNKAV